ncbi:MAG TPA: type II secretion system protein GspC [Myxococcales bacterium]|nr:type II secretion system protein GspC [Myxococcales bacterium]
MERFFRKYFWSVNLAFIALVALLAARTVNVFLEAAIAPASAPRGQSTSRAAVTASRTVLDLEKLANLVGLPLPPPEPDVVEPQRPTVDLEAEPVKSGLRVRLLGTLLSGVKEWSFASIQDVVTQKASTFMVGMEIQGAPVLDIERSRVIVLNNGRREFINNEAGSGEAVAYVPPPGTVAPRLDSPPAPGVTGSGIKAIDDSHYEVPRAEIDRTLSNLNDVAMQARIVPAFKDGVAQGFKLFSIRPDSIYTKIGIQNGDVIKRINGYDLNSPEKALEIYSKLKEASRIDIEVERNGSVLQKTYNVR